MDNSYQSLISAFPDPLAIARRRAQLRLISILIVIALVVTALHFALASFQLWYIWPIFWRPTELTWATASGYISLHLAGIFLLYPLGYLTAAIPASTIGRFRRPLPALVFTQALLAAIAARDPAVAAPADADQVADGTQPEASDASVEHGVAYHLTHPAGATSPDSAGLIGSALGIFMGTGYIFVLWIMVSGSLSLMHYYDPTIAAQAMLGVYNSVIGMSAYIYIFIFSGCAAFAWGRLSRRYANIARHGLMARVDKDGIQAQFIGASEIQWTARWDEVTGFARLYLDDHEVYLLLAGERVLLWDRQPLNRYAPPAVRIGLAATRADADTLVAEVARYAPVPLVDVSAFLSEISRSVSARYSSARYSSLQWNLLGNAERVARSENDQPLWQAIWEKSHPGKPARYMTRRWSDMFLADIVAKPARNDILRAAKALLPYYPTPAAVRATLQTGFLSRGYVWFSLFPFALSLIWAVLGIALRLILYNHGY
ncbi:MAG TPA: hypothetical protein VFQ25_14375 [Ktedonobacterales bacterium]|nr:hypothetical protein [Ktedonobacterales bacterium]